MALSQVLKDHSAKMWMKNRMTATGGLPACPDSTVVGTFWVGCRAAALGTSLEGRAFGDVSIIHISTRASTRSSAESRRSRACTELWGVDEVDTKISQEPLGNHESPLIFMQNR